MPRGAWPIPPTTTNHRVPSSYPWGEAGRRSAAAQSWVRQEALASPRPGAGDAGDVLDQAVVGPLADELDDLLPELLVHGPIVGEGVGGVGAPPVELEAAGA